MKRILFVFIFSLTCLILTGTFVSCKKSHQVKLNYSEVNLDENIVIHRITFQTDSTGFLCGGIKNKSGCIYKTTDAGASWNKIVSWPDKALYDIHFTDKNNGYACGDRLLLLITNDGGLNWHEFAYPFLPAELHIVPLRHIYFTDPGFGVIVGGENFSPGVLIRFINGGFYWEFKHYQNEFRRANFFNSAEGLVFGYGAIYKTLDSGNTYQKCGIKGDFFDSFVATGSHSGLVVSYEGGIYQTSDAGDHWKTLFRSNDPIHKRIHFNDILFAFGKSYIVGPDGLIMLSEDGGDNWVKTEKFSSVNFNSLAQSSSGKVFIAGDQGKIVVVTP